MTYTGTRHGAIIRSTCDDCNAVASQSAHQYGRAVLASWEARHTCPTAAGAVAVQGKPAAALVEDGAA